MAIQTVSLGRIGSQENDGIWNQVGGHLHPRALATLSRTCKGLRQTVLPLLLKTPLVESGESLLKVLTFLKNRPDMAGFVEELCLSQNVLEGIVLGDLQELLCLVPSAQVITLEQGIHLTSPIIASTLSGIQALHKLSLPGCPVNDRFLQRLIVRKEGLIKSSLKVLELPWTQVSLDILPLILHGAPALEELTLTGASTPDIKSFTSTEPDFWSFLSHPSQETHQYHGLRLFNASSSGISDKELALLSRACPLLEEVYLESCQGISDAGLGSLIRACPFLATLDVSFSGDGQISDRTLGALAIVSAAAKGDQGSRLRELSLCACDQVSDRAIHQLVLKCPRLSLLVLDGCERILGGPLQTLYSVTRGPSACLLDVKALQSLSKNGLPSVVADPDGAVDDLDEMEKVNPLRTLTRRASRIIQQRSTPHLSLTKVNEEAEAFQLERLERIRLKRLSEEKTRKSTTTGDQGRERDGATPSKTVTKALSCSSLLTSLPKPRQDYILLAAGRRCHRQSQQKSRVRRVSSGRLLSTPPSSPTIMEDFYDPDVASNADRVCPASPSPVLGSVPLVPWGQEPRPWVSPSLYSSNNSRVAQSFSHKTSFSDPTRQEQSSQGSSPSHSWSQPQDLIPPEVAGHSHTHTSYTNTPSSRTTTSPIFCASSPSLASIPASKSIFRMKIEVRKGHFEVLEILEDQDMSSTLAMFCQTHGINALQTRLLSVIRKKLSVSP